jgi:hypothetical protein
VEGGRSGARGPACEGWRVAAVAVPYRVERVWVPRYTTKAWRPECRIGEAASEPRSRSMNLTGE